MFIETEGSVENYLSIKALADNAPETPADNAAPPTAAHRGAAAIALVQEDVAVFSAAHDPTARAAVQALARPFTEYTFFIAGPDVTSIADLSRIDVGAAGGGSAYTYDRIKRALPELLTAQGVRVAGRRGDAADAHFRLRHVAPGKEWGLLDGQARLVPLESAVVNQVQLAAPVYHRATAPGPGGKGSVATIGVDAVLVASPGLPVEVGEVLVQVVAQMNGVDDLSDDQVDGRRRLFSGMRLAEHPGLIRAQRGPYPYVDVSIALIVAALLLMLHLWARRSGRIAKWVEARDWPEFVADRRLGYAIAVLLALACWTFGAALLIKYYEVQPLLQGLGGEDSGLWRMKLSEMMSWMFVLVTMGHGRPRPRSTFGKEARAPSPARLKS